MWLLFLFVLGLPGADWSLHPFRMIGFYCILYTHIYWGLIGLLRIVHNLEHKMWFATWAICDVWPVVSGVAWSQAMCPGTARVCFCFLVGGGVGEEEAALVKFCILELRNYSDGSWDYFWNAVGLESRVALTHDFSIRARSTNLHQYWTPNMQTVRLRGRRKLRYYK